MTEAHDDVVTVSVPSRPEFVQLLRSVAGSVAARRNLTYEAIEDLRLVVDEACANLLRIGSTEGILTLRISTRADGIEILVSINAGAAEWPPPRIERSLTWQVMSGLSDDVRAERLAEGPALRILKGTQIPTRP